MRKELYKALGIAVLLSIIWPGQAMSSGTGAASVKLPDPVPCPKCWRPPIRTSWQWHLRAGTLKPPFADVDMYIIEHDEPADMVRQLKERPGRRVMCYISAGSWEPKRADRDKYPKRIIGSRMTGAVFSHWASERWVDIRDIRKPNSALAAVLRARMDICAKKGFDGIEFDNVMTFEENHQDFAKKDGVFGGGEPGKIGPDDQLYFNAWLANEAHLRGLSVGLKNDVTQIEQLVDYFDWALNEDCFEPMDDDGKFLGKPECLTKDKDSAGYDLFVAKGKAVFGVAYPALGSVEKFDDWALKKGRKLCPMANAAQFNWLLKEQLLGPKACACLPKGDTCVLLKQ